MKLLSAIIFIIVHLANTIHGQNHQSYQGSLPPFSKDSLNKHLQFLGSDTCEGRGTGTAGGNLAAKYLANEFEKLKLTPLGFNASYFQYIPMHGSFPLPSSELIINNDKDLLKLKVGDDYLLYKSGEQTFVPGPLPLVFAGYGIIAPEFDYNDYQSINADGKIVVILEGEPPSVDPGYFSGNNPSIYSSPEAKQRIAISRGAAGSIIIPAISSDWNKLKGLFSFEDVTLAYTVTGNLSVLINPSSSEILFRSSGYNIDDVYKMHLQNRITSFPLKSFLSFKGDFRERDFVSPNILGMIEGSDPELRDKYLLITAHYDHLGTGPAVKGDSIYNGVSDNAIGTAALLELSRIFSLPAYRPKRSIIFALLTGEEKGLLGAVYYTENPVKPLYKTIANVNIDGLAFFERFKSIIGIGSEYSTLKDYLNGSAQKLNLEITSIPPQFEDFESFSKSDQIAFALAGIPSILIAEGPDYENLSKEEAINKLIQYSREIYHTPFDDLNQPLNFDASVQHLNIIFDFCSRLANSEKEPKWNSGTQFINARLRSQAEKK